MKIRFAIVFILILTVNYQVGYAQVREVPFETELLENSKKMTVKIGNMTPRKTYNIRFGAYTLTKSSIKNEYDEDSKFLGIPIENNLTKTFYTTLLNKKGDTVWIDAAQNINLKESHATQINDYISLGEYELITDTNVSSVILNTSLNKDDYWLLLMSKTEGTYEISLKHFSLSNGTNTLEAKIKETEAYGSFLKEPSRGIEFFFEGKSVGGMQYKTGGGLGYKQFVWISEKADKQMQLLIAGACASILQLTEGALAYYFTE